MLAKRIIPCLDVKDGVVVKGVRFEGHEVVGDIAALAKRYSAEGADELVFYDITASAQNRSVDVDWIARVCAEIDIPFCVAGGIRSVDQARQLLFCGADKISINSPALERPALIDELVEEFGSQCIVVGIDSFEADGTYQVYQYTGDPTRSRNTTRSTLDWAREAQSRGAGEIVLNCMNQDGVRKGYDIAQLSKLRSAITIPLVASGGAGAAQDFVDVFQKTHVDGALAASVFHKNEIKISELRAELKHNGVHVRP